MPVGNSNAGNGDDGWGTVNAETAKMSPSYKPPSTGGNVMGTGDAAADDNKKNGTRSNKSKGSPMPGTWPQSGGGNVYGGSNQGSNRDPTNSPSQVPPPTAGNVAGNNNDWGEANATATTWRNTDAANSTGGFWETKQGKAEEAMVDNQPAIDW